MNKAAENEHKAVRVSHVGKSYGRLRALNDVSFDVDEGEVFGLIGPDGSGKTSLFRLMATLLPLKEGSIQVHGMDVMKQTKGIRGIIGYMPGRFSLYPDLSVEENLNFFATLFGTTVAEGYATIAPIYSQIEPFRKRRAGALSGGMKQKLALSCALVHRPRLLLLDEPTTGVDPVSRKELWDMLGTLRQAGITIIAATPYLDEVRRCHRVAFLSGGRVAGIGTPDEILTRFRDIFNPDPLPPVAHAEEAEPAIEVSHLVKAFGSFRAVDDISFSVRKGEIFGFLGANGAGKSTAMHMLTGLSRPTAGTGRVMGFDIERQSEKIKAHIGYMSQRFSLYEDLTVKENLRLFGGIYGMSRTAVAKKTDRLLKQLGMEGQKNSIVGSLPLGWKQKLAFSVSILHNPGIVFLDEPTGGVDPKTRQQFWELIYEAARGGITIFVTTHYMDEAEYCDRISIMVDGKIKAIGAPDELKRKFDKPDMDGVFTYLARTSTRQ